MKVVHIDERTIELVLDDHQIISVKVSKDFLRLVDSLWPKLGFRSRSDFVRHVLREYIERVSEKLNT